MASSKSKRKNTASKNKGRKSSISASSNIRGEVWIWLTVAFCILLLIGNFGFGGIVGSSISSFFFGVFGIIAYGMPFILFFIVAFMTVNKGNRAAVIKTISFIVLLFMVCTFIQLSSTVFNKTATLSDYYTMSSAARTGGGVLGGLFCRLLYPAFGRIGTYVIIIVLMIICIVLITERSLLRDITSGGKRICNDARTSAAKRRSAREDAQTNSPAIPSDSINYRSGKNNPSMKQAPIFPSFSATSPKSVLSDAQDTREDSYEMPVQSDEYIHSAFTGMDEVTADSPESMDSFEATEARAAKPTRSKKQLHAEEAAANSQALEKEIALAEKSILSDYSFPPMHLLKSGNPKAARNSQSQLAETRNKLQQTLTDFGVDAKVTNVVCGPSVTRYEIEPQQGVKVSRILNLADDIKLNLAARDIRIEAPIPGKAAIGIEVPNKVNTPVMLKDLLESDDFQQCKANLAFAVGRDIGGSNVITDISCMPHLLIGGATGSGKSVCINTLIMSILYKSRPEDVRMIMIDPKMIELNLYNGIPHLLIPVVTDPKKAAGALHWAVAEMTKRYKLFAELGVRDLAGYNERIKTADVNEEGIPYEHMPQILIIVDEFADLMMVSANEVEESVCRLAQLARAAGIHLILATQRPSVDVITGLIKANMPSRIALAVSSGVDSRTIIDMVGAEKLLGKGDMLFYPSGNPKPVRVQGAFVSEREVEDVVEYLIRKNGNASYDEHVETHLEESVTGSADMLASQTEDEHDAYFAEAGRLILEKDKASIGMLQRVFRIGFNRAARIMDQLNDAGVVSDEDKTKPRSILMTTEQFEQYLSGGSVDKATDEDTIE